jgi:hypothetical protein
MIWVKRVLSWIISILLGAFVNTGVLQLGLKILPPPEGSDFKTSAGLAKSMPILGPEDFIAPFLAHFIGTFASAFLLTWLLKTMWQGPALIAGIIFLSGGIYMVYLLPAPLWFEVLDLTLGYVPAAYLGYLLGVRFQKRTHRID